MPLLVAILPVVLVAAVIIIVFSVIYFVLCICWCCLRYKERRENEEALKHVRVEVASGPGDGFREDFGQKDYGIATGVSDDAQPQRQEQEEIEAQLDSGEPLVLAVDKNRL